MGRSAWGCALLVLALITGCASPMGDESATLGQQDSVAAVRIKASLFEAEGLAGSAIDVDLKNGRVVLDGFVETQAQREQAEAIARRHKEVIEVENRITVK